jgi:hypothetical protein
MARLVVNPGSRVAWDIVLKPGTNTIGRGPDNDFQVGDPSVSGSHCQILVQDLMVVVRDLGSTNGTFVNRAPVKEATLEPGHTLHLGSVEMLLQAEQAAASTPPPMPAAAAAVPVARPMPAAPGAAPKPAVVARIHTSPKIATPPPPTAVPSAEPPPVENMVDEAEDDGPHACKFHPKSPARYRCDQCHHYFCELCVGTREAGGSQQKICRHCGVACVPVRMHFASPASQRKSFFAMIPDAFIYPFRGSGIMVLIVATLLFSVIDWMVGRNLAYGFIPRAFGLGLAAYVFALGYTFSYMQSLVHSAAVGEREMPPLPSMGNMWSDIVLPGLQMIGIFLLSFAPAIAVAWWTLSSDEPSWLMLVGSLVLGVLYFPMAFLAAALLDSVLAANPLQVIPSIAKVPLQYLVAVVLLGVVFALRPMGSEMITYLFPRGISTRVVSKLLGYFAVSGLWGFFSVYLMTVGGRLLGLLYYTNKEKLGWLDH